MDFKTLLPVILGWLAPLVVSALRRSVTIVQDRTARLQHWKTLLELKALVHDLPDGETKTLCSAELAEAEDETKNLSNKTVTFVTAVFTLFLMWLLLELIAMVSVYAGHAVQCTISPQVPVQQLGNHSQQTQEFFIILQLLLAFLVWFWLRWVIRNAVWRRVRPNAAWNFLVRGERREGVVKLALMFALLILAVLVQGALLRLPAPTCPT